MSGGIRFSPGSTPTLIVGNSFATARTVTLEAFNGTIEVEPTREFTLAGAVGGAGALYKRGFGTLTLQGTNASTGGTFVYDGKLKIDSDARLGPAANDLGLLETGPLRTTTTMSFDPARVITLGFTSPTDPNPQMGFEVDSGTTLTIAQAMTGGGGLNKFGEGALVLSGANSYAAGTIVNQGTLRLGANERLGNMASFSEGVSAVTLNGGIIVGASNRSLSADAFTVRSGVISANLAGAGLLRKEGSGLVTLGGSNSYRGGTEVTGGTLQVGQDANLGAVPNSLSEGRVTLAGGALEATASFSSNRPVTLGAGNGGVNVADGAQLTMAGPLSGTGGLLKGGAGTLLLTGAVTMTGSSQINVGTLVLPNGLVTPGGGIGIAAGGELRTRGVLGRAVTGQGTITASGDLIVGDLTGSTGIVFDGTVDVGAHRVILGGFGQSKLGGAVDIAGGGTLSTIDQQAGTRLNAGGTVNASGAATINGTFLNYGLSTDPSAPASS